MTTGTPLLTYRSTAGRVGAWFWMAFAAGNLIDIAVRGRDVTALLMACLLLFGCGLGYVLGLRPVILADEAGITIRNPLRDARAPWRAVRKVEGTDAVTVRFAGAEGTEQAIRAWVLQTSPRAQAKAEARAQRDARHLPKNAAEHLKGQALKGRTPTAFAAKQLTELAEQHRPKGTEKAGALAWSRPAVAALAVPGVLVLVVSVVALVG